MLSPSIVSTCWRPGGTAASPDRASATASVINSVRTKSHCGGVREAMNHGPFLIEWRQAPQGDDALDDLSLHVGQPHFAAGVPVGQLLVVEAKQVQNRGMPVVYVYRVFDGLVSVVVSLAIREARLDTAAGHPDRVAFVVMVAAVAVLGVRSAAELAAPDHQGVVQADHAS